MSEALGRVRRRLLKGRVDEARALLVDEWRQFPASETEILELLVQTFKITFLYSWHDLTERFLDEAGRRLGAPATPQSLPLRLQATIRSARSLLEQARFGTGATGRFLSWFLGQARTHPELWTPFFVNQHLSFLVGQGRFAKFDATLRRLPISVRLFSPVEHARLLSTLSLRLGNQVQTKKQTLLISAALRKLEAIEPNLEGEWLRAQLFLGKARTHAVRREPPQSQQALRKAARIIDQLRCHRLFARLDETRAFTLARLGRYAEALEAYRATRPGGKATARSPHLPFRQRVAAILEWARCAIWCWRFGTARRLLDEAEALLDRTALNSSRAFLGILRGRLELEACSQPNFDVIHEHLRKVRHILELEHWWETRLAVGYHLLKGEVACSEGDIGAALRHSKESNRLIGEVKDMAEMDSALYLQSCLLVEGALPHATLYDATRHRAVEVPHPGSRFKVLANLYLYTWRLGDEGLELSDGHLKELLKLRETIDEDRFQGLYQRYVTEPMLDRLRTHLLGG